MPSSPRSPPEVTRPPRSTNVRAAATDASLAKACTRPACSTTYQVDRSPGACSASTGSSKAGRLGNARSVDSTISATGAVGVETLTGADVVDSLAGDAASNARTAYAYVV